MSLILTGCSTFWPSYGGAYGLMVILDMMTQVQNLNKAVCISQSTDNLGKDMDPTILPPAMGKWQGRLGCLTLVCVVT